MTLYVHNTLTRRKEEFKPLDAENVRLYACGPTVYSYAHIGNARPAVVFDLLAQLLRHIYGREHVRYTCNITDIDDKIINTAKLTEEPISAITEKFACIYNDDLAAIGVEKPISIMVDTFGTEKIDVLKIEELVGKHFDLTPEAIIETLKLKRPVYRQTAAYGHFGRNEEGFTWEITDKADSMKADAGI